MRYFLTLAALFGLSAAFASAAVSATAPTVFGQNLIVNGNAEAAPGSADDGQPVASVPGWTRDGNFNVVQYGASGGFPDATSPGPKDRGKNFFAGGPDNEKSSATQTIDVSAGATQIDAGKARYTLSGYLGGFETQGDHAFVTAAFLNASGATLGSAKIGPVLPAGRNNATGLVYRHADGTLPPQTRSVVVTMTAARTEGSYNDGEADNLSLALTAAP